MLARAKELGNWLLPAFNTDSGWPLPFYRLGSYVRPLAQGWQSADFQLRRNPDGIKSPRILVCRISFTR